MAFGIGMKAAALAGLGGLVGAGALTMAPPPADMQSHLHDGKATVIQVDPADFQPAPMQLVDSATGAPVELHGPKIFQSYGAGENPHPAGKNAQFGPAAYTVDGEREFPIWQQSDATNPQHVDARTMGIQNQASDERVMFPVADQMRVELPAQTSVHDELGMNIHQYTPLGGENSKFEVDLLERNGGVITAQDLREVEQAQGEPFQVDTYVVGSQGDADSPTGYGHIKEAQLHRWGAIPVGQATPDNPDAPVVTPATVNPDAAVVTPGTVNPETAGDTNIVDDHRNVYRKNVDRSTSIDNSVTRNVDRSREVHRNVTRNVENHVHEGGNTTIVNNDITRNVYNIDGSESLDGIVGDHCELDHLANIDLWPGDFSDQMDWLMEKGGYALDKIWFFDDVDWGAIDLYPGDFSEHVDIAKDTLKGSWETIRGIGDFLWPFEDIDFSMPDLYPGDFSDDVNAIANRVRSIGGSIGDRIEAYFNGEDPCPPGTVFNIYMDNDLNVTGLESAESPAEAPVQDVNIRFDYGDTLAGVEAMTPELRQMMNDEYGVHSGRFDDLQDAVSFYQNQLGFNTSIALDERIDAGIREAAGQRAAWYAHEVVQTTGALEWMADTTYDRDPPLGDGPDPFVALN